jgi:integrase
LCQPSGFSENRRKAGYDRLLPCVGLWLQGVCPDNALYIKDYLGYVCVHEIGDLIKPHYVTESFPKLLKAKGMRQIRYHDLRHSCASLLLANGVPMKQIQEWLGHSDFSTTANIYAHLDYSSKLTSADAMLNGLGFAQN